MPLTPMTSVLAAGLLPMFVEKTAPESTRDAAELWAHAYVKYAIAGGIPAAPKEAAFADALEKAFNPSLAGKGPDLFIKAIGVFWMGLPVPEQLGTVTLVTPSSSTINSPQPENATPADQANALAAVIASFTLSSVKVLVPPGLVPIPIV